MAIGGASQHRDEGQNRPPFVPAADWPTNRELVERALCRRLGACPCAFGGPCLAHALFGAAAQAVLEGLTDRHRLRSPTIERGGR